MNSSIMESYSNVAIVGAGQLGSRYLQGLVKCSILLHIWIVDPNSASLSLAHQRWREAGGEQSRHRLEMISSVFLLPKCLDLALITTSADVREAVVVGLSAHAKVKYWVLEKVLAQSASSLDVLLRMTVDSAGSWVNTPRRMMSWYKKLHATLIDQLPLRVHVGDSHWGLACNAIHFIDMLAWWTNTNSVDIDIQGLDPTWIPSKRKGFLEVTGILKAHYADGSTLVLESGLKGQKMVIQVETSQGTWTINEAEGIATGPEGQQILGRIEFQSEMSTQLVDLILTTGSCDLPTLASSVQIHRPFLQAMLDHWNRFGFDNNLSVPVT